MNARLDAVNKARQAYFVAKSTLEHRLREQLREELSNLQTQVDVAVRYAYDSGESKANILRSMGTKDYGTLNASLGRTSGVSEVRGVDPLDSVYSWSLDQLVVTYVNHGPKEYSGTAVFDVARLEDGTVMLWAETPLWDEDFKQRNDVVAVLDGKRDGFYYEEAVRWIGGN